MVLDYTNDQVLFLTKNETPVFLRRKETFMCFHVSIKSKPTDFIKLNRVKNSSNSGLFRIGVSKTGIFLSRLRSNHRSVLWLLICKAILHLRESENPSEALVPTYVPVKKVLKGLFFIQNKQIFWKTNKQKFDSLFACY